MRDKKKRSRHWLGKAMAFLIGLFLAIGILGDCPPARAAELSLNKTTLTMSPATTASLKLAGASSKVKWSSNRKKVASVNSSGKVTAKKKGTAKITATYKGISYTCKVTVAQETHSTSDGMRYKDSDGSFGYTGRWFQKELPGGSCLYTNTEGSAIYFKVTGSKYVNVGFVNNTAVATPYFAYSVDGGSMKRQLVSKGKIGLGNNKTHYVRLVIDAMSENEDRWNGEAGVGIRSVTPVSKDGVVAGIQPENAAIAFYGDSITQGVRALNIALTPYGTSSTNSYAWYCASQLDLVPYLAGYGGSGIVQAGCFVNCSGAISNFSAFRGAESYEADVVVVEHGTNDVYTFGDAFIGEYRSVLNQLHLAHPKAYIMAMIPFNQLHAAEIRAAASSFSWCTVVETSSWGLSYTDGIHPNASGGKKAGKKLAKIIAAKRKVSLN